MVMGRGVGRPARGSTSPVHGLQAPGGRPWVGAFSGVVLCGGASRRMGRDKALIEIGGQAMASRVAEALWAAGATEVTAIGGDGPALTRLGLSVQADRAPGAGPLAATMQGLDWAGEAVALVVSCDLLAPSPVTMGRTVEHLVARPVHLVAVPTSRGRRQWTHAAWRVEALPALESVWQRGTRSLFAAATELGFVEVASLDPAALEDADTPGQLTRAMEPMGPGGSLPRMDVPEIDVLELAQQRDSGAPLIDVREADEYVEVRVPGAHHIPLAAVPERVVEVPAHGVVYVICARGGRSAKAVEHYRSLGIDAVNVTGGTVGWIDAGLPVDRGPGGS